MLFSAAFSLELGAIGVRVIVIPVRSLLSRRFRLFVLQDDALTPCHFDRREKSHRKTTRRSFVSFSTHLITTNPNNVTSIGFRKRRGQ